MEKTLKGAVDFQIDLKEDQYGFQYDQKSATNELAALMIAREILKYNKQNLLKSLDQAKGTHLNMPRS